VHHRSGIFIALLIASFGLSGVQASFPGTMGIRPAVDSGHHDVQTGSVQTAGSQIIWTTNVPASSSVDYGTSSFLRNQHARRFGNGHEPPDDAFRLAPGTTYYYQVNSTTRPIITGRASATASRRAGSAFRHDHPTAARQRAAVALSGTASGLCTADSAGNYTFAGLPNGSYMVTRDGTPLWLYAGNQSATVNGANVQD